MVQQEEATRTIAAANVPGATRAFDSYQIALEIFAETTGTE